MNESISFHILRLLETPGIGPAKVATVLAFARVNNADLNALMEKPSELKGLLTAKQIEETDHLRYGVFRWYRYQHMHMVVTQIAFQYLAFLLPGQVVQQLAKILAYAAIQHLSTPLWDPHYMILAFPLRVT
jgi:hypothetical protein